jgi:transposase
MVAAGFYVNSRGGTFEHGKAQPIQDKVAVARKYFEHEENLLAGQSISVMSLAKACFVSWGFASKVVGEIENGQLIDPRTSVQGRKRGNGAITLTDGDGFYLLHLRKLNNRFTLRDYAHRLAIDRGTYVSKTVICKWFRTTFTFKGSMRKLNKVPIDKFTDNNVLRWAEFNYRVGQVPPWRLVFGDEKPLKGGELFDRWGRADPLTGIVEDFVVDSDWRNTYAITGLCRIGRHRPPFSYIVHDGSNNAAVFCDFVIQNLSCGFLLPGDFLILDNASIHNFQESTGLDAYLWNYHGIFLQFLPTRSPELNPIELLWNILVQRLKHVHLSDDYFAPSTSKIPDYVFLHSKKS